METKDLAWLAGLLEGEGCFLVRKSGRHKGSIAIALQMTDEDVVQRAASLLGGKINGPYGPYGKSKLPTWQVVVFGKQAAEWMMTLYSMMGVRRQEKIKELLDMWKQQPVMQAGRMALCHPDRPRHAKDLCSSCYMKNYHAYIASRY